MSTPHIETLEIIGTTTVLADLPKRLSPVYRRAGTAEPYYFTVAEDDGAPPALSPEHPAYFIERVAAGDAVLFAEPIPARAAHRLLQVATSAPPEYLPYLELPVRLRRAAREALERAARALADGRRADAEERAWVARRADRDDPLPLLVLISLLKGSLPADELCYLHEDLDEYPPALVDAARRRAMASAELRPLGDLLDEPPESGERPSYLLRFASRDDFLPWTRALNATKSNRRGSRAVA